MRLAESTGGPNIQTAQETSWFVETNAITVNMTGVHWRQSEDRCDPGLEEWESHGALGAGGLLHANNQSELYVFRVTWSDLHSREIALIAVWMMNLSWDKT